MAGKRRAIDAAEEAGRRAGFRSWHERGYLPHRDAAGLVQFVSFRLADSFPESLRAEWEYLWGIEDEQDRQRGIEAYLDKSRGVCYLRSPEAASIVEQGLVRFHDVRYELLAWVVMPNHVHALLRVTKCPLGDVVGGWKKHSAREVNRLLGREGALWAPDYWDTYMRDSDHERRVRDYIEGNPVRAHLIRQAPLWPWTSARYRDAAGTLCVPRQPSAEV